MFFQLYFKIIIRELRYQNTTISFKTIGTDRRIAANVANTSIPFSMLYESGCFDLKLNIDRGGGRGGERIYRQQFLHTGLLSNTVCVPISFESDCRLSTCVNVAMTQT